jgi:hypothetical protein
MLTGAELVEHRHQHQRDHQPDPYILDEIIHVLLNAAVTNREFPGSF